MSNYNYNKLNYHPVSMFITTKQDRRERVVMGPLKDDYPFTKIAL